MEDSRKRIMDEAGVDIPSGMERFMNNEEMFVRFLKKFKTDPNYESLKNLMAEKNYEEAFKAAHTIKGLCGNLSLQSLFDITCEVVEFLRHQQYAEAEEAMPKLVSEYERVVALIDTL